MLRMLNRRQFTQSLGATALIAGMGRGALATPQTPATNTFSVMMWTLKKTGSFEENLERVAQAGFQHVELVGESVDWSADDFKRIMGKMASLNLTIDAMTGVKDGFADPAAGDTVVAEMKALVPKMKRLGCPQVILTSGKMQPGVAQAVQHAAAIETLKRVADVAAEAGVTAVIEPIDRLENPTLYLDGVTEAFEMTHAVGSPHVKVLYDVYHEQRSHGNLIEKMEANADQIGLVHIADVPGRHQPGSGEIDYANVYRTLAHIGYKGVIAMEFYATGDPVDDLRKAREAAVKALA